MSDVNDSMNEEMPPPANPPAPNDAPVLDDAPPLDNQPVTNTTPPLDNEPVMSDQPSLAIEPVTGGTQPLGNLPDQPNTNEPLEVGTVLKDAYRVTAILTDTPTLRVYRVAMLEPWDTCAKCGAKLQQGDQFCEECGAQIEEQTALLQETPASSPVGAALLGDLQIDDEQIAKVLPTVREVFVGEDSRFAVVPEAHSALVGFDSVLSEPDTVIDQADALYLGSILAKTLAFLHRHGFALRQLTLADLALTTNHDVVITNATALRRAQNAADQADDVQALGGLLEKMTGVTRDTRRLDENQNPTPLENSFATLLSDIRGGNVTDAAIVHQTLETIIAEQATPTPLRTRTGYATHTGMVRDHNEDSLFTWDMRLMWDNKLTNIGMYIVADGMGGHEGGEVASGIAINTIAQTLTPLLLDPSLRQGALATTTIGNHVKQAITQANAAVYNESVKRGNDMGTTLTMAVVIGNRAIIGNVGDSRTYLYHNDKLQRVTKDHSLVQRLVDIGQIAPDDVYSHPNRNAILRSLGDSNDPEADIYEIELEPGEALFLCSDGMWEMVRDPKMSEIISSFSAPPDAAQALIKEGNANGGEDNISVVLVQFSDASVE